MFFLRNLSTSGVTRQDPWLFTDLARVPAECLGAEGKKERQAWMTAPNTEFHAYSLFEGVNPNARISDKEENSPALMHGLAVDYDFPLTDAEIDAGIARMDIKPNWRETTLSGNCRLLWIFSKPLPLPSYGYAVALLQSMSDIIPFRQLAGIDEGALKAPERYFTNGCIWTKLNPLPVPWALLFGHAVRVSEKFDWKGPEFGVTIPLEVVAEKLAEKFPRFAEWPGDFVLGAQGPSFWVGGSISSKSAIVRETGLQTFAGHAHKSFFNWSELIGADFCDRFKTEQIGKAVDGVYYDEKHYWSRNNRGLWCLDPKENIVGLLKHERGMSDMKRKGENTTELERALVYVQRNHRIKVADSFAFYPEGVITVAGQKVLNTHSRKTAFPAPSPVSANDFPFLWGFLKTFFNPPEQLDYFLSWLAYFYAACYRRAPRSGQGVFIAGGTNVGKTFLNRAVIGTLVGGFGEANEYLLGSDNFNSELTDVALWVVDDGSIATDFRTHKRFSEMVKRMAANPSMRSNGKFLKANTVLWQGRIVVTMNTDADSIRMLPDLDLSLREKISIFRAHDVAQIQFLEQGEMDVMLTREIPAFARFLLDYRIPDHCQSGDPRFGVSNYLEKSLVNTANQSSVSGTFGEILEEWQRAFFVEREPHAMKWEGTALQLHKSILIDPTLSEAMKPYNVQAVGRMLVNLASKKVFDIRVEGDERRRIFVIPRDEKMFPAKKPALVAGNLNSHFQNR